MTKTMWEGPTIVQNLFFTVTCVSIFTCVIRADYNFALGFLSYYLMKNANPQSTHKTAFTVSLASN